MFVYRRQVCQVNSVEAFATFFDHSGDDVVESQFLYEIVLLDGGLHKNGGCVYWFNRLLTFFSCDDRMWGVGSKLVSVFMEDMLLGLGTRHYYTVLLPVCCGV